MESSKLDNCGIILSLVAAGGANSRSEIQAATGLSRMTVTQRVNLLLAAGLLTESPVTQFSGGRPSRLLRLKSDAAFMLTADIGESYVHLAAMDLSKSVIAQSTMRFSRTDAPGEVLERIGAQFQQLANASTPANGILLGVCLALPTPVDFKGGRVVGPSVLPGWDDLNIIGYLKDLLGAPVYVENDVNLMTLYELRQNYSDVADLFFIKAGTGIGSGIISNGTLFRGAQGAAGDIGHIQFSGEPAPLCRCGKLGCVEARAGGWAIARELTALGTSVEDARGVIDQVRSGKPEALMLVRAAGRTIGEVTSDVVSILNPSLIVVGGTLATAGELLLSGIRELVYQRCLPLATRDLRIVAAEPFEERALFGGAHLLFDTTFEPVQAEVLVRHWRSDIAMQQRA